MMAFGALHLCSANDPTATNKTKYIGRVNLARKSPLPCHFHLYKAKEKGRKDRRSSKVGRNHTAQASYASACGYFHCRFPMRQKAQTSTAVRFMLNHQYYLWRYF